MRIYRKFWNKKAGFTDEMCALANAVNNANYALERDIANRSKALRSLAAIVKMLEFMDAQS